MIGFFRQLRRSLVTGEGTGRYLRYAIGEVLLVVLGILIALQVNNWNESRQEIAQERFILERMKADIADDVQFIDYQIEKGEAFIERYKACLDILLGHRGATLEEFRALFNSIKVLIYFEHNRTTFDHIISTGQIEVVRNQALSDAIIRYYSTDTEGWDSGLRAYTRNVIVPFLLAFDHVPQPPQTSTREDATGQFTHIDVSNSQVDGKTLDDYKNSVFVLNILRERLYLIEGQLMEYRKLKDQMAKLTSSIDAELL